MTVGIEFENGLTAFGKAVLEKPENKQELIRLVSMQAGKQMQIKYVDKKNQINETIEKKKEEPTISNTEIPFNVIEE